MKHTKREILEALRIIQDECRGTACEKCPFGGKVIGSVRCLLIDSMPVGWLLNDKHGAWKALLKRGEQDE